MAAQMTDEPRLKTKTWVQAGIRRGDVEGLVVVVVRSGDPDAGSVLVKLNRFENGCVVYSQTYNFDGKRVWISATGDDPVDEPTADAYITRTIDFDPDLWVLEVEDRDGRVPFDIDVL